MLLLVSTGRDVVCLFYYLKKQVGLLQLRHTYPKPKKSDKSKDFGVRGGGVLRIELTFWLSVFVSLRFLIVFFLL